MYGSSLLSETPPPAYHHPDQSRTCDPCRIFLIVAGVLLGLVGLFAILHDQGIVTCGLGSIGTAGGVGMTLAGFFGSAFAAFFWNREEGEKSSLKMEDAFGIYQGMASIETRPYETIKFEFTPQVGEKEEIRFSKSRIEADFHQTILRINMQNLKSYSVFLLDKHEHIVNFESRTR